MRIALALMLAMALHGLQAQDYPVKPVRIVVPYGAGSNGENGLRLIAPEMEARLGQRILIEQRPGGGGNVGAAAVAGSAADGYTLLLGATNNFTINQHLYKGIGFDPVTAFEPITMIFDIPFLMYSSTAVPARTLGELVAYARANPDKLNYASSGAGTPPHLAGEMLSQLAGIRMTHVPYKSNAQSVAALLAGEVHLFVGLISGAQAQVDAGKLRILATAVPQRTSRHPDVPSAREAGLATMNISTWWALAAPRSTPKSVVDKLYATVQSSLRESSVRQRYEQLGMVPVGSAPHELASQIRSEAAAWREFIHARNIGID